MNRLGAAALLAVTLLAGCAAPRGIAPVPADPCAARLVALEDAAARRGTDPGEPRGVPGFPELGTNRVLAAFAGRSLQAPEFDDWVDRLAEAGQRRRRLLQLDPSAPQPPGAVPAGTPDEGESLEQCAARLLASRQWDAAERERLAAAVRVPDDYITAHRVLGLYPLTSLPARGGVRRLHQRLRDDFATPLAELPLEGQLVRFVPTSADRPMAAGGVGAGQGAGAPVPALAESARDALGLRISRLDAKVLAELLAYHAPVLEIDRVGSYDVPGKPFIDSAGAGAVDASDPRAYVYPRVMPFAGELRLQLVYVFWFDARPRSGIFDTLGGDVDGIVWRVTLDRSGEAMLYDSIHPCGCYHQYFPAAGVRLRASARELPEPPLVPDAAPKRGPGERAVLRLASGTHYLQRVYASAPTAAVPESAYRMRTYDELYRVPAAEGPRSFFARHGLVPGTARGERFYLWPMGVRSPGAMRERGRQATAFLGRRHFDDADLLDALFEHVGR